ncbi:ATP-grasp domain-containing protein [Parabacteroides distasonis]|jgi:carB protein|uniref:ATP-grasp domain-containing protein n=1 Tax=Parabacteroides distasonis TaxID=823 RepID=UPI00189DC4FD|nr:ATP-grasp domain-containing protein [Parabacteroides distasonis]MDB9150927.1 ATP-grasp domain-containing protein [Parabacteroides distasonis]MDB9155437.1 ATP-grasp domain-containing protein [Parabacteroides distasonis]MDB9163765.1 ATP-grasp domain-containing protein [Parabacteroides distasonis]MDB9167991.1 ATP-grasp domain-containing protein [Parabacteroides distasonis]MDB9193761.1 ATP-grasp domain-containing protein [Parabacteroides distasonis]
MNHNIIITSAGQRVALVRDFKETLVRFFPTAKVFTTDMNPELAPAAYVSDGCFEVLRVTDENYIPQLLDICKNNEIGMIVPTIDTELLVLAKNKKLFNDNGIIVSVSDLDFITVCRDKRNTGDFLEEHNIRVPKEVDKYNPTFPLFAKPYDGSLSTNLHYIKNAEELTQEILDDPKLLFMEYIDKETYKEYTIDMYYGKDNRVKCIVPRERIKIRAGEINKGLTVKHPLMEYIKERLDKIEGCIGCICIQVFFNPETEDVVGIEINPRFGGGYPQSYAAGGNYPEMLIKEYFLGEEISYIDDWKDNLLMLRFDDAVYA